MDSERTQTFVDKILDFGRPPVDAKFTAQTPLLNLFSSEILSANTTLRETQLQKDYLGPVSEPSPTCSLYHQSNLHFLQDI